MTRLWAHTLQLLIVSMVIVVNQATAQELFMGEYEGTYNADLVTKLKVAAQVVDEGSGRYRIRLVAKPNRPDEDGITIEIHGKEKDNQVILSGRSGGRDWTGHTGLIHRLILAPGSIKPGKPWLTAVCR